MTPRLSIVSTSHSAECTALRAKSMPSAPRSDSGPRIQNATASPVEMVSATGAAGWVAGCAATRKSCARLRTLTCLLP